MSDTTRSGLRESPPGRWCPQRAWLPVWILAGLWSVAVGWLAVARHGALNTGYDLATFAQVVWATGQGHPFYTSLTAGTTNFLGLHFSPLLAVLAPFYSIWPDARLLLLAQTVVLAAGAIPLFGFARRTLSGERTPSGERRLRSGLALLVVLVYFLTPALHFVALFEFHAIALSVPLLMAAGAALLDKRPRATLIWLGLALLVKEEVALIAIGFGLYAVFIQRRWRYGLALTAGAVAWTILLFAWIMPAFRQTSEGYAFAYRYETLGGGPGQVLRTLFTKPRQAIGVLATRNKMVFLGQLLAPLAGLPLLGLPAVLLTLPTLAYLLLSDYAFMVSIRYHYTAPLLPFLLLATVIALQRMQAHSLRLARLGGAMLLAAALAGAWYWSPLPGGRAYEPDSFVVSEEDRAVQSLLAAVPADAAVAADWSFLPWLANRWQLDTVLSPPFELTAPDTPPDYLPGQSSGAGAISAPVYPWVALDRPGRVFHVPRYLPQQSTPGGVVLWKWRGPEHDVVLAPYDVPFEREMVLVAAGLPPEFPSWGPVIPLERGVTLPVWLAWAARRPLRQPVVFTLHLVDEAGARVAQVDQEMGEGRFPTTLWHQWIDAPVVVGEFQLHIPADLPQGRYRLLAGAYTREGVVPLVRPDGDPWLELTVLEVLP